MKKIRPGAIIHLALVVGLFSQIEATGAGDPLDQWHRVDTTGPLPGYCIRYGQGKWLGLDSSRLLASTNGTVWTIGKTFGSDEEALDLIFADGLWVLTGRRQPTNLFVLSSTDGESWTAATIPPVANTGHWPKVQRHNDEWIITSTTTNILRSTDARNWSWSSIVTFGSASFHVDHYWVAQAANGPPGKFCCLLTSTNLTEWHWWRPWPFPDWNQFYTLKFAHGLWFGVVGPSGDFGYPLETSIVTSTDGTNWVSRHTAVGISDVEVINDRLVGVSLNSGFIGGPMLESEPLIWLQQGSAGNLTVHRASGIPVIVEASGDLRQWHTLTNLPLGKPVEALTDPAAIGAKRFYRARTP